MADKLYLSTERLDGYQLIISKRFPDGDEYVRIPQEVAGREIVLLHRCWPDQNSKLVQLLLIMRTLKELGALKITLQIPYLPYARQDKRVLEGESVSAQIICKLLKEAGAERLVTLDCHFLKREGDFEYAGLKITNISAATPLLDCAGKGTKSPFIITPDEGAAYFAQTRKHAAVLKKIRGEYGKGKTAYRKIESLQASENFNVAGWNVVIIDDIVGSGSTMIRAVQLAKKAGAKSITCACTHGMFLNGADRKLLSAGARKLISTNSIPTKYACVDAEKLLRTAR